MRPEDQIKQLTNLKQWADAIEYVFPALLKPYRHKSAESQLLKVIRSMIDDLSLWAEQDCTWTAFQDLMNQHYGIKHITVHEQYIHLLTNNNAVPIIKMALAHILLAQVKAKQHRPSLDLSELYDFGSKWMELSLYIPVESADQLAYIPILNNSNNKAYPYKISTIEFEGSKVKTTRAFEHQDLIQTNLIGSSHIIFVRLRIPSLSNFNDFFKNKFSNYVLSYFELSEIEVVTKNPRVTFPSTDLKDITADLCSGLSESIERSTKIRIKPAEKETDLEKPVTWVSKIDDDFRIAELCSGEWKLPVKLSMLKEDETIQDYFKRTVPKLPVTLSGAK